jgi:hypothetical protein
LAIVSLVLTTPAEVGDKSATYIKRGAMQEKKIELDPEEREWEYDDDGKRIYKAACGFGSKTVYDNGYALWRKKFGHEWDKN